MRRFLLLSVIALLVSGCAHSHRPLRQNSAPVDPNDSAAQTQAARGEVQRGFTAPMVERALGVPPQIKSRALGPGFGSTWIYPHSAGGTTHIVFQNDRVTDILHVK